MINNIKIVDYYYVQENDGMWVKGNLDIDDYIYYIVNDELVKVAVDVEYLREKHHELEKIIYKLIEERS